MVVFFNNYDPNTGSGGGTAPDPTDPNLSYGDNNFPPCDNILDWTLCFDLIAGPSGNCTTGATDCGVTMQTYADGEIGIWNSDGMDVLQYTSRSLMALLIVAQQ